MFRFLLISFLASYCTSLPPKHTANFHVTVCLLVQDNCQKMKKLHSLPFSHLSLYLQDPLLHSVTSFKPCFLLTLLTSSCPHCACPLPPAPLQMLLQQPRDAGGGGTARAAPPSRNRAQFKWQVSEIDGGRLDCWFLECLVNAGLPLHSLTLQIQRLLPTM